MELPVDIRHAEHLIGEAVSLMTASFADSNRDEFLDELSTYWTIGVEDKPTSFWYLPSNPRGTPPYMPWRLRAALNQLLHRRCITT